MTLAQGNPRLAEAERINLEKKLKVEESRTAKARCDSYTRVLELRSCLEETEKKLREADDLNRMKTSCLNFSTAALAGKEAESAEKFLESRSEIQRVRRCIAKLCLEMKAMDLGSVVERKKHQQHLYDVESRANLCLLEAKHFSRIL